MGNQPVNSKSTSPSDNFDHAHFGKVQISTDNKGNISFTKVFSFGDMLMSQQKLRRIKTRIKKFNPCPHIIDVKSAQLRQKQEMCAHNSEIYINFEKYDSDLRSVIKDKLQSRKNFTQNQICQFLKQTVEALIYIQDNGLKNSILDKDSILLCGNNIKIIDTSLASINTYQSLINEQRTSSGIYLSPQLLKEMKENNFDPYISPKSDVFTLGMLVLEMACLQSLDNFYDYKNFTIDYESLIHRVSRILFSVQLKTLIAGMLQFEPEERLGLISLHQKIIKIVNPQDLKERTQRSRSSSTKMLKDLLTNSRGSKISSSVQQHREPSLGRKNSVTSLASITSIKDRISVSKKEENEKKARKKQSSVLVYNQPGDHNIAFLKNIVKAKTSTANPIKSNIYEPKQIFQDKQNNSKRKSNDVYMSTMELIQMVKNPKIEGKSFTRESYLETKQLKTQMNEDAKFGLAEYSAIGRTPKYEESIFKMIEDNFDEDKTKTNEKQKTLSKYSNTKSALKYPKVANVINTNSIEKEEVSEKMTYEVNEFSETFTQPFKENTSVSAKIKNSLDKMYKTTKSINSSEEKSPYPNFHNLYIKVMLDGGYYYEGQGKQNNQIQGNGILYTPQRKTVYSGSWVDGKYHGFGKLNNIDWINGIVTKDDLKSGQKCWVKYEGEFKDGEREGFGTMYYANGERFSGCFKKGQANGYGCFYDKANEMTSGFWNENLKQNYQSYS